VLALLIFGELGKFGLGLLLATFVAFKFFA
jgi:hypothetical protein